MADQRVSFEYAFELKGERQVERAMESITKQILAGRSAMDVTAFAIEKLGRVFHVSMGTAVGAAVAGMAIEKFAQLGEKVIETRKLVEELSETPIEFLSPEKAAQNLTKIQELIKSSNINQASAVMQGAGKFGWDIGRSINSFFGNKDVPKWDQKEIDEAKQLAAQIYDRQLVDAKRSADAQEEEANFLEKELLNKKEMNKYDPGEWMSRRYQRNQETELGQEKISSYTKEEADSRKRLADYVNNRGKIIVAGLRIEKNAEDHDFNELKIKENTLEYEKRKAELSKELHSATQKRLNEEVKLGNLAKEQYLDNERSKDQLESLKLREESLQKQMAKTAESFITKRISDFKAGKYVAIGGNISSEAPRQTGFTGGSGLRNHRSNPFLEIGSAEGMSAHIQEEALGSGLRGGAREFNMHHEMQTREYGRDSSGLMTALGIGSGGGRAIGAGTFSRGTFARNNFPVNATNLNAAMAASDPVKQQLHELKEIKKGIDKLAGVPMPAAN